MAQSMVLRRFTRERVIRQGAAGVTVGFGPPAVAADGEFGFCLPFVSLQCKEEILLVFFD